MVQRKVRGCFTSNFTTRFENSLLPMNLKFLIITTIGHFLSVRNGVQSAHLVNNAGVTTICKQTVVFTARARNACFLDLFM